MTEQWRHVVGYEGFYEVSELGRVRSMDRVIVSSGGVVRFHKGIVQKWKVDSKGAGYVYARLCKNNKAVKSNVHVLVLEAFVGPRPSGFHACHADGDRTNPVLSNLRWDTVKANAADKLIHGTHGRGERGSRAVLTTEQVHEIRSSPLNSLVLARRFGVAGSTVRAVRIGQNWSTTP